MSGGLPTSRNPAISNDPPCTSTNSSQHISLQPTTISSEADEWKKVPFHRRQRSRHHEQKSNDINVASVNKTPTLSQFQDDSYIDTQKFEHNICGHNTYGLLSTCLFDAGVSDGPSSVLVNNILHGVITNNEQNSHTSVHNVDDGYPGMGDNQNDDDISICPQINELDNDMSQNRNGSISKSVRYKPYTKKNKKKKIETTWNRK